VQAVETEAEPVVMDRLTRPQRGQQLQPRAARSRVFIGSPTAVNAGSSAAPDPAPRISRPPER
jgi:hypothetical protein